MLDDWVNSGVYVLGEEALARLPEKGDHERDVPRARRRGQAARYRHKGVWLTVNTPKDLRRADEFMREHPNGVGTRQVAAHERSTRSNFPDGARPLRVRRRAGREAVGLGAHLGGPERYVGKILFVRGRQSLSLQFHNEKDESWYVVSGRAELELGDAGQGSTRGDHRAGACFRYRPGTVHRVTALEDTMISRSRPRTSTTSCGSRTSTAAAGIRAASLTHTCVKVRPWTA